MAASLAVAALAANALNVSSAMANNEWANYHWSLPAGGSQLTIEVNNCQVDPNLNYWDPVNAFSGPNADWDWEIGLAGGAITIMDGSCPFLEADYFSDPIGAANSGAFDLRAADFAGTPTVNSFNDSYGNSGWVGVAIVALPPNDSHIFYGEVYLNDYYPANSTTYNQPLRMRKVQCQEVGHTFGLDHVRKDISCMYSSRAFIGSVYTPSPHDADVVNSITHDDGAPPPPPDDDGGGSGGPCAKNPNHWKCQAQGPVFRGKATWAERYDSQDEMFEAADAVVSATVLNGSMFDRVVGAPGRGLPVSQAVLQIQEVFKGKANGVVRIEHTRGLGLEIEDDPGYVNGDDYLLFLRQIGAKTYRVVNPQGRIPQ